VAAESFHAQERQAHPLSVASCNLCPRKAKDCRERLVRVCLSAGLSVLYPRHS
jgi:hypothetical protein